MTGNTAMKTFLFTNQRRDSRSSGFGALVGLAMLLPAVAAPGASPFVHESATEFFAAADVNGDGFDDVVVLDKATGNVRVGYQNAGGALTWSAARPSGVAQAASLAVGRFLETNRQAIAVTSLDLNRIHLLDLANPSNAPAALAFRSPHAALTMLVGLDAPYGAAGLPAQHLD